MDMEKLFESASLDGIADNVFGVVNNSVSEVKEMQRKKVAENVQLVVDALKKIESNISSRYDLIGNTLEKRILTIKDGRDGIHGRDGRNGKDGKNGRDGLPGPRGADGKPGRDGADGSDGVSVTDAKIDFDGSLIISLSSGREINVGEVVAPALAEQIKVITNGGGTSQSVIDTLASLQAQITALSGAVIYKGLWNALTNTPTLTSSVGTSGNFYIVSATGSTDLNGITNWGVGDWAIFNGTAWQRVEGGAAGNFTTVTASGTISAGDTLSMSKVGVAGQGGQVANTNTAAGAWASWRVSNGARALHLTTTSTGWSGTHLTGGPTSEQSAIYTDGAIPLVFGVSNTMVGQFTSTGLNNAAIGATTASTGAFTTLGASGNVTLSGGTANGVAYLNGSKVLTTGSALTFDGTNLTNSGNYIGTASVGRLTKSNTTGRNVFTGGTTGGTTDGAYIIAEGYDYGGTGAGGAINLVTAGASSPIAFLINGSEQMRLTSTGLGIGTSSPSVKLDVAGNATVQNGVLTIGKDTVYDAFINTPESMYFNVDSDGNSTGNRFVWGTDRTGTSGGTEWMRLDSSGNLGLGVTPSAWSGYKAIQINGPYAGIYSSNASSGSTAGFSSNCYYNGTNWIYINPQVANRYEVSGGAHYWFTAPSGTAGNAISFTQAMDLANSSGASTLTVNSAINTASTIRLTTNGGLTAGMFLANPTVDHSLGFQTAGSERARIPAAGGFQCVNSISVGNATPTTSGAGITFPATQSASTDANTLDDYEEGTWTPADGSGAGLTLTTTKATYVKVGSQVTVQCYTTYPSTANASGAVISGLPFAAAANSYGTAAVSTGGAVSGPIIRVAAGGTTGVLYGGASTATAITNAVLSSQFVIFTGTYFV